MMLFFSAISVHEEHSLPKKNGDAPSCNLLSCVIAVLVAAVAVSGPHALAKHGETIKTKTNKAT